MKKIIKILFMIAVFCWISKMLWAQERILPSWEMEIIHQVAQEYRLTDWQTALLIAIRKSENGGRGREFGVLHPRAIDTTYRNQAQWAAGSIKKRCPNKILLVPFLKRWAPGKVANDPNKLNRHLESNVRHWLARQGL